MSAGAAAAAAAARRRMHEEEEEMTPYNPQDLAGDWEFKILRSATRVFKNPERLRQVLEQEALAGWTLVEKFDENRIRLKRPASARNNDTALDFDAYRTWTGMSEGQLAGLIVLCVVGGLALLGGLIAIIATLG